MNVLSLRDSCLEGDELTYYSPSGAFMEVVDELAKQYGEHKINVLSLSPYNRAGAGDCPLWYDVKSYTNVYGKRQPDHVKIYTSHYIGSFSYKGYSVNIAPRFGEKILNHLLGYAANIHLPVGSSKISWTHQANSHWLAAVLWKALLNKAITLGQTPKEYKHVVRSQRHFRGKLVMPLQIRHNLCDASRFYCSYRQLSVDTTINRVVRTVYQAFKQQGLGALVSDLEAYDERLCASGVQAIVEDASAIDHIRYTKMNAVYEPVMKLSKSILSNLSAQSQAEGGQDAPVSYFVDVAELWELYLLKVLRKGLSAEYKVYSPNASGGLWLLHQNMREIRPDILIEKDGRVLMVIDAKYKAYTFLGKTANEYGSVSRDDLYQMCTYLYHYGRGGQRITGLFTSPQQSDGKVHPFTHDDKHSAGLLNLDITAVNDLQELRKRETSYVSRIKELLQSS